MIQLLSTNWAEAWTITGYGVGTVFVILCVLVLILTIFSRMTAETEVEVPQKAAPNPVLAAKRQTGEAATLSEVMGHDEVAIATAIYMYYNDMHDIESGVLTIKHNDNTAWHFQLGN